MLTTSRLGMQLTRLTPAVRRFISTDGAAQAGPTLWGRVKKEMHERAPTVLLTAGVSGIVGAAGYILSNIDIRLKSLETKMDNKADKEDIAKLDARIDKLDAKIDHLVIQVIAALAGNRPVQSS